MPQLVASVRRCSHHFQQLGQCNGRSRCIGFEHVSKVEKPGSREVILLIFFLYTEGLSEILLVDTLYQP